MTPPNTQNQAMPTRQQVEAAMQPSVWELSNRVLYDLCRDHPKHERPDVIVAKLLMIGRVYAAAIERRRKEANDDTDGDHFYTDKVVPSVLRSGIDQWIAEARACAPDSPERQDVIVRVHGQVTSLFDQISGQDKRSLASKYLHFHVPDLFFIYDTRAVEAMRAYSGVLPRTPRDPGQGDNEYRKFAHKAHELVVSVRREHGLRMTPRQLDNLLLSTNG